MKKSPKIFMEHMLMAIEQIEEYLKGYDEKKFLNDQKTIDAVIRQMEIFGEAAGNIPQEIVENSPVPWHKIVSLRNKLIHQYFGVDIGVVWKTATESLGGLKGYLRGKIAEN